MPDIRYLDNDIIRIYERNTDPRKLLATLFWGDRVLVVGGENGRDLVEMTRREWDPATRRYVKQAATGVLPKRARYRQTPLLKVRFVDVGQGDGAMIDTPGGQIILVDGGEEEHLRRYLSIAYSYRLDEGPLPCAAVLATHGDADHYSGLTRLLRARRAGGGPLVTADRVFHNGLVKDSFPRGQDRIAFGATQQHDGRLYAVALQDDLRQVPDDRMNRPFLGWKRALEQLTGGSGQVAIRRLQYGDHEPFNFLAGEGIRIEVLGPIVDHLSGAPALPFLKEPGSTSLSASHTVNGHSVVLKMTYGNVRFLFGADLNEESEERLRERAAADNVSLAAEVLKVPHHGSADFSPAMLAAVQPVVSVVSSGDESVAKEYIHPRAGLVGALGKYSRAGVEKPLVYVTEMVAFFERVSDAFRELPDEQTGNVVRRPVHNAYRKTQFGIVHARTDGERVLVATHSGKDDQKESYAFHVDNQHGVRFEAKPDIV